MKARLFAVIALVAGGVACHTGPKPVNYSPRLYLHQNQPKEVWLNLKDGSRVMMVGPRVLDDTLFGWSQGGNEDLMVALSDIKSLDARKINVFRTSLIPAAFVGAGTTLFLLVHHPSGLPDSTGAAGCPDGECENSMP
jgi:hypothetical protein